MLSWAKVKYGKEKLSMVTCVSCRWWSGVLPSEGETSIAAARMITQTTRSEHKLVHIFRATLDLSRIARCEHEWSSELWSFIRKKEELAAMSNVTWMETVMLQSWQIKDRQTRAEGKTACLSCPFMSRFRWNIRCWILVSDDAPVTWLRCYTLIVPSRFHQNIFNEISLFTLNISW